MVTQVDNHEHFWGIPTITVGTEEIETYPPKEFTFVYITETCQTCKAVRTTKVKPWSSNVSEPPEEKHYHCWHSTGVRKLMYPPLYPMVCCHCGEVRNFLESEVSSASRTKTHGPHVPRRITGI